MILGVQLLYTLLLGAVLQPCFGGGEGCVDGELATFALEK